MSLSSSRPASYPSSSFLAAPESTKGHTGSSPSHKRSKLSIQFLFTFPPSLRISRVPPAHLHVRSRSWPLPVDLGSSHLLTHAGHATVTYPHTPPRARTYDPQQHWLTAVGRPSFSRAGVNDVVMPVRARERTASACERGPTRPGYGARGSSPPVVRTPRLPREREFCAEGARRENGERARRD